MKTVSIEFTNDDSSESDSGWCITYRRNIGLLHQAGPGLECSLFITEVKGVDITSFCQILLYYHQRQCIYVISSETVSVISLQSQANILHRAFCEDEGAMFLTQLNMYLI